jgi:flagellin
MALNIVSNFAANVAQRNLVKTDAQVTSSLAKLSSGSRVVSARDDAASLAVGSRLRAEVASLKQASVNAGQAVSMLQIADGALATTGDILVRMKALSVQSSSGQLSQTERNVLDAEFQALKSEVDRIASDTEFNGTTLIAGSDLNETRESSNLSNFGITGVSFNTSDHDVDGQVYRVEFASATNDLSVIKLDGDGAATQTVRLSSTQTAAITALTGTDTLDIAVGTTGLTVSVDRNFSTATDILESTSNNVAAANADVTGFNATFAFNNTDGGISVAAITSLAALTALDANGAGYNSDTGVLRIGIDGDATANEVGLLALAGVNLSAGVNTAVASLAAASTFDVTVDGEILGTVTMGAITSSTTATAGGFLEINIGQGIVDNNFTANGGSTSFTFQIGTGTTNNVDRVTFSINTASSSALGISGNDILSDTNSRTAITSIGTAIDSVNSFRANVGAAQNRLDFATSNLAASTENAEAARSQLLDLDIASEITNFTSKQVLMQAGVSMLAQANQLPQNLLQLLQ